VANNTVNDLSHAIGVTCGLAVESLIIHVKIADIKMSYGRPLFLVRPVSGAGEQWVEQKRLREITQ